MKGNRQSPSADSKPGTTWLSHTCPVCEVKGGTYLSHYGVMRCSCGSFFWALQPRRDGPLVLFPHPGFYPGKGAA